MTSEDSIYISIDGRNVGYDGGIVSLLNIVKQLTKLGEITDISFRIEVVATPFMDGLSRHSLKLIKMCRIIPVGIWDQLEDNQLDDYLTVALAVANEGYYLSNDGKMHEHVGKDDDWRDERRIKFSKKQPWKLAIPDSELSEMYDKHFENGDLDIGLEEWESEFLSEMKRKRKWQKAGWICPTCGERFIYLLSGKNSLKQHTQEETHSEDFYLGEVAQVLRIRNKMPLRPETISKLNESMERYRNIPFQELERTVNDCFDEVLGKSVSESLNVELRGQVGIFVTCPNSEQWIISEMINKKKLSDVKEKVSKVLGLKTSKLFLYFYSEDSLHPLDPILSKVTDGESIRKRFALVGPATIDFTCCALFPNESQENERLAAEKCMSVELDYRKMIIFLEVSGKSVGIGKIIGRRGESLHLIEDQVNRIFGSELLNWKIKIQSEIESESRGTNKKMRFRCPECDDRFPNEKHLNQHRMKEGHACIICEECSEVVISNKEKSLHVSDTGHKEFSGTNFLSHNFRVPNQEVDERWFNTKDVRTLRKIAKERGITGYSKLTKKKLIELLLNPP